MYQEINFLNFRLTFVIDRIFEILPRLWTLWPPFDEARAKYYDCWWEISLSWLCFEIELTKLFRSKTCSVSSEN